MFNTTNDGETVRLKGPGGEKYSWKKPSKPEVGKFARRKDENNRSKRKRGLVEKSIAMEEDFSL